MTENSVGKEHKIFMKRVGNLWDRITDLENIKEAHRCARKDKTFYREVKMVDANLDFYAREIQQLLRNKLYSVSEYRRQLINDKGKERLLMKLQYYPDRIIQWAIMLQLEPIFLKTFCKHTCASIPKRGLERAWNMTRSYIDNDPVGTKYCYKMDVRKFYDSIDHNILKKKLRRKIKDKDVLWLLDTIIDSYPGDKGVPIGSYLSQYFANFYLSDFDHYLKEDLHIAYCVRYMDDVIIFSDTKEKLHEYHTNIVVFLHNEKLELKGNYQIFSTGCRGVDFVGFRFFPHFTLLRKKSIKNLKELSARIYDLQERHIEISFKDFCAINSYAGWLLMCDSYKLRQKYIDPIKPAIFSYYVNCIQPEHDRSAASYRRYVRKFNAKKGVKAA